MLAPMRDPDADSTDDDLFDWFIAGLNQEHRAREVRDGVIEVDLGSGRRVELLLTRAQLREAAWSDDDIFDDTHEPFVRSAVNPVIAGLRELLVYADEELASLRDGENYVVLEDGMFHGSKAPTVPPARGRRERPEPDILEPGDIVVASRESEGFPLDMTLFVAGELFHVKENPDRPGDYHFDWLSGPNEGFGFGLATSNRARHSIEELREDISDWLATIDPETGYTSDDEDDDLRDPSRPPLGWPPKD